LNLSENTVRSHLKQIFQKTDTHGQMELVHLHARVCPALP
jgi:DNA-binding CsgD family transcriptional regulator